MPEASVAKHPSFRADTAPYTDHPTMSGDVSVAVAILGAGIIDLAAAAVSPKRMGKAKREPAS